MRWIPLESNPDAFTKFARQLGLSKPWGFTDVYGFDAELQAMVPKPIAAVLLLYPLSKQLVNSEIGKSTTNDKCFFMRQSISNACGTVALIHALANSGSLIDLSKIEWLNNFIAKTRNMSPEERAAQLEQEKMLGEMHEKCAHEGQTETPDITSKTDLHFIAFVNCDGTLLELDGRRESPVQHCATSQDTFLSDVCSVVQQFMQRDPTNLNFSVMALANLGC